MTELAERLVDPRAVLSRKIEFALGLLDGVRVAVVDAQMKFGKHKSMKHITAKMRAEKHICEINITVRLESVSSAIGAKRSSPGRGQQKSCGKEVNNRR